MTIYSLLFFAFSFHSQPAPGDSLQVFCNKSEFGEIQMVVNYTTSTLDYKYSSDINDVDRAKFVAKPNGVLKIQSSEKGRLDKCRVRIKSGKMIVKTKRNAIVLEKDGC